MPEFSKQVISLFAKREAAAPGGLLTGNDPTEFNSHEPIRLWIIQLGIIVCTAGLLSLGLKKLRQPKVIAEVLGGIILGPTAFGRIPGFTEHIFPQESRPYLSLTANIGLCLFLFLVGLEIDADVIKRNARLSATVALAGMVLPFGIGAGLAYPIYKEFIPGTVEFTHFMLFTGVAFSITAFPVLCRILTELKLLDTTVGIVVLSAGVGNDIVGWVLLALSVALVNGGAGLTALYILLVAVGWTLVILFPVRWGMLRLARLTGSIESGPSVIFMTATMMVLFGSAFFTDIIGVHAIFGAFLAGLVVPREGNLAITLTEKLEDMVAIIFLPLYFTLSGLSTDLGMLNNGITWGYTIAIVFAAFIGKFGGCTLAAHYAARFNWRESATIGSLMSCKGLVELIVLNIGLSAGILSQRVFSMFVLEALVLTFATTPLVEWLYPPTFRVRIAATGANFKNVSDGERAMKEKKPLTKEDDLKTRFTVVLDKVEHLGGIMALVQLINPPPSTAPRNNDKVKRATSISSMKDATHASVQMSMEALRIIELSDRTSAVMKSSAAETILQSDPLLSTFRMYGVLNSIDITPSLSIVKYDEMAYSIAEHARENASDMILIPWLPPKPLLHGSAPLSPAPTILSPEAGPHTPGARAHSHNPFDMFFRTHQNEASSTSIHSQFVRSIFSQATVDAALFMDRGMMRSVAGSAPHIFLPFYGGPDDRLALDFVVQLCDTNSRLTATVIRFTKRERGEPEAHNNMLTLASEAAGEFPDTYYGDHTPQARLQSETADNIAWAKYARVSDSGSANKDSDTRSHRSQLSTTHPRIEFKHISTLVPLKVALQEAADSIKLPAQPSPARHDSDNTNERSNEDTREINEKRGDDLRISVEPRTSLGGHRVTRHEEPHAPSGPLIVVTGRSRRLAVENHRAELKALMDEYGHGVGTEVRKTIGDVATAFELAGVGSGIVIVQATVSDTE